ncbi:DNA primase [Pseudoruegeria sp. SK021]|uniref:DNA primase n=1 Tax=Pseudoruegeria sp. SK021 TaxID=1933035 RepID=UPI000A23AC5A|nr:DNA primase [Pseudoruegeria sp. SK021]OSP55491.1 DNA primase [Pseudoruegeria sp. SK021]
MSLPPGFLEELRGRSSLAQVVGRKVIWDARKSNQGKGDMWAPCPFHQEKSASFHVDDRKGFYYCFGCHAKGDAISFLRETENMGFMEAVELLAREVGMPMPARDPQAQQKADRRTELSDVMEAAVQFYRLQLSSAAAVEARAYLDKRGLRAEALNRFWIGYAPDTRQGVFRHLTAKGIAPQMVIDAGLAALPDGGGAPYDRFRGRIIYPIRDLQGRCIGLGGRAMAADAKAKYLNSPETELFDKGRSLYNQGPAREAVGKGAPLIVSEGYMDVIALVEAGFGGAVAPLGTAITEDQLQLLWRLSPEPIIALDGDRAGLRAAQRLIDLALPLLEAGKSLRFCLMPEGQDPDDLIRAQGAAGMQAVLDAAQPMVRLLWQRETEGVTFDSPERKAGLDKILFELTGRIQDQGLRHHYREDLRRMQWEFFNPRRTNTRRSGKPAERVPSLSTRTSLLASQSARAAGDALREAVILASVLSAPQILDRLAEQLSEVPMSSVDHQRILNALLDWHRRPAGIARDHVVEKIGRGPVDTVFSHAHVQVSPVVRKPGDAEIAYLCASLELAKLASRRGVAEEIAEQAEDFAGFADDGAAMKWRIAQANLARHQADLGTGDDKTDYETGPNGADLNKDERSALDRLIRDISYSKSGPN